MDDRVDIYFLRIINKNDCKITLLNDRGLRYIIASSIKRAETSMKLPEEVTIRYKNIPKQWLEFIVNFVDIMNGTNDMWFLTCENFSDGEWSYNSFENMSLEAADGDEVWSAEIKTFWDNTLPIIISVGGDYQYFAMNLDSGEVVQGWEPEFEETCVVAVSFDEFIKKVISDEISLVV